MVDIGMDGTAYNGDDVLLFGDMDNFTIPLESSAIKSGRLLMSFFAGSVHVVPRIYRTI